MGAHPCLELLSQACLSELPVFTGDLPTGHPPKTEPEQVR